VGSGCGGSTVSGIDHSLLGGDAGGGATIGSLRTGGVLDGGSAAGATGSFEVGLLGVAGLLGVVGLLGVCVVGSGSSGGTPLPGNGGSFGGPTTASAHSHVSPQPNHRQKYQARSDRASDEGPLHARGRGGNLAAASMDDVVNLLQLEARARGCLPREVFDYIAGGACDELCLSGARAAFDRIALMPRVLVDVSQRSKATTLCGHALSAPLLIAPTAMHVLVHREAEIATARAAARFGTIMVLSTLSSTPVEEVVAAAPASVWFQLYVHRDRALAAELIARVEAAGCRALVLTVDAPVIGLRERDVGGVPLPPGFRAPNLRADVAIEADDLHRYFAQMIDASLDWDDLAWLRSCTKLPFWLKGIVRADDAARAVAAGVAGIVVSNHGGRQLDGAIAPIDALPAIAATVDGRVPLLVDGGVRRGTDVIKAIARGAQSVLVGRPILWGLALGGSRGVEAVLDRLADELDVAMALCGCPDIAAIGHDLLA
jgi:4-hydroxymandelate oxidase